MLQIKNLIMLFSHTLRVSQQFKLEFLAFVVNFNCFLEHVKVIGSYKRVTLPLETAIRAVSLKNPWACAIKNVIKNKQKNPWAGKIPPKIWPPPLPLPGPRFFFKFQTPNLNLNLTPLTPGS